jgi:DNA mismatch repair protein MutS2
MAKRNKALSDKTDKIISRAKDEAERILDEAKKEADKLISDMKKAQKLRDAHEANRAMENARRKFNEKKKSLDKEEKQEVKAKGTPPKTVKKGDSVNVLSVSQIGTVITLPDSKGDLIVKVGIMKINTNLSDLRLVKEEAPKKEKSHISSQVSKTMDIGMELDVRGENVEDAIYLLEKFLDDAILSSLSVVRVIHGKGTGVLRNGLHAYLKKQPRVKTYRLGTFGEGDAGVTVIELK